MTADPSTIDRLPRELVAGLRSAAAWAAAMAEVVGLRKHLTSHGREMHADVDELLGRYPERCASVGDLLARVAAGAVVAVDEVVRAADAPPGKIRLRPLPECPTRNRFFHLVLMGRDFDAAARQIGNARSCLEAVAVAPDEAQRRSMRDAGGALVDLWSRAFDRFEFATRRLWKFSLRGALELSVSTASRLRDHGDLLTAVAAAAHAHLQGGGAGDMRNELRRLRAAGFGWGAHPRT